MAQLVLFYSKGGTTKRIAEAYAKENGYDVHEIVPLKKITTVKALMLCPKAMRGGSVPVQTMEIDFSRYELIHLFAPIWAGFPAPPMNTVLSRLPKGTEIALHFVSAGGSSHKMFKCRDDLKITSVTDIKSTDS